MKSYMAKTGEIDAKWYVVDATDKVVGRLATKIAMILMGKHRPEYTPHVDTGEFVIVTHCDKLRVTGANKGAQRVFHRYTGYASGLKEASLTEMLSEKPTEVLREAVRRMLPKSKLGVHMLSKLKVYSGAEHPHQAQQPQVLDI